MVSADKKHDVSPLAKNPRMHHNLRKSYIFSEEIANRSFTRLAYGGYNSDISFDCGVLYAGGERDECGALFADGGGGPRSALRQGGFDPPT